MTFPLVARIGVAFALIWGGDVLLRKATGIREGGWLFWNGAALVGGWLVYRWRVKITFLPPCPERACGSSGYRFIEFGLENAPVRGTVWECGCGNRVFVDSLARRAFLVEPDGELVEYMTRRNSLARWREASEVLPAGRNVRR